MIRPLLPIGTVVVGLDGSPASAAALAWALDDARRRDAHLRVVAAWHDPSNGGADVPVGLSPELLDRACAELIDEMLAQTPVPVDVPVQRLVRRGRPADVLLAETGPLDLLVTGTRGDGGFPGLLLGSVSARCIQGAQGPVVVVPCTDSAPASAGPVVVGVDGSPASVEAVRFAADEACRRSVMLRLVHAAHWDLAGHALIRPDHEQLQHWGRQLVRETGERALPGGVPSRADVGVVDGHPGEVLVAEAASASLLVVGGSSHGVAAGVVLGSVSWHCAQHAACPVALVPWQARGAATAGTRDGDDVR